LQRLGHQTIAVPVQLDLGAMERRIEGCGFAFNLVETFAGTGRLQHFVPS
jgi:hypothetical protein